MHSEINGNWSDPWIFNVIFLFYLSICSKSLKPSVLMEVRLSVCDSCQSPLLPFLQCLIMFQKQIRLLKALFQPAKHNNIILYNNVTAKSGSSHWTHCPFSLPCTTVTRERIRFCLIALSSPVWPWWSTLWFTPLLFGDILLFVTQIIFFVFLCNVHVYLPNLYQCFNTTCVYP